MSTRVLVTGATSAPGLHLLHLLAVTGAEVTALVRSPQAATRLDGLGVALLHHDLEASAQAPRGSADLLLHVAGVRHARAADELARRWGCGTGVCVSSASATVEGHPLAPLVLDNEALLAQSVVDWRILRPTMIFGSHRDRNVRLLARALHRLPVCPRFSGGGQVQPVFVDDVAAAVQELGERALDEDADLPALVPYGGTNRMTFGELIEDVRAAACLRALPVRVPVAALATTVRKVGADRHSRIGHALSMLTTTRVVPDPHHVGLRHRPHPWLIALGLALERYRHADAPTPVEGDAA